MLFPAWMMLKLTESSILTTEETYFISKSIPFRALFFPELGAQDQRFVGDTGNLIGFPLGILNQVLENFLLADIFLEYQISVFLVMFYWTLSLFILLRQFTSNYLILYTSVIFIMTKLWFLTSWMSQAKVAQIVFFCLSAYIFVNIRKKPLHSSLGQLTILILLTYSLTLNVSQFLASWLSVVFLFIPMSNYSKVNLRTIRNHFRKIVLVLLFLILLHSPAIYMYYTYGLPRGTSTGNWLATNTSYLFSLIGRGAWWEYGGFHVNTINFEYIPWIHSLDDSFYVLLQFFVVVFVIFVSLFILYRGKLSNNDKRLLIYVLSFAFTLSILSSGSGIIPFYDEILLQFRTLMIFREPWAKFNPLYLILFTILICISISLSKNKLLYFSQISIFLVVTIYGLIILNSSTLNQDVNSPLTINRSEAISISKVINLTNKNGYNTCILGQYSNPQFRTVERFFQAKLVNDLYGISIDKSFNYSCARKKFNNVIMLLNKDDWAIINSVPSEAEILELKYLFIVYYNQQ